MRVKVKSEGWFEKLLVRILKHINGIPPEKYAIIMTKEAAQRMEANAFVAGMRYADKHPRPRLEGEMFDNFFHRFWVRVCGDSERGWWGYERYVMNNIRRFEEESELFEGKE